MARRAGDPVRAGGRVQRHGRDEGRREARGRARRPGPGGRVAAAELRRRVQRAAALRLGADRDRGSAGITCWSAGPCSPARKASSSWPSTAATRRARSPWPSSPRSRARGGESRTASPRRRTRPAWTTTRSAATAPGTGTSPCPCSRTRSSPSPPAPPGPRNPPLPAGTPASEPAKKGT